MRSIRANGPVYRVPQFRADRSGLAAAYLVGLLPVANVDTDANLIEPRPGQTEDRGERETDDRH